MRILLFSSSYAPQTGGLQTVTRRLARELADVGHEVMVATNRYPRHLPPRERIDGTTVFRQLYPDVLPIVNSRSPRSLAIRLVQLPLVPIALLRLLMLVRRMRPDVMNIHYFSHPAIYALIVARILHVPVAFSCHGSDVGRERYPAPYEFILRMVFRLPATFTVPSQYLAGRLLRFLGPDKQGRVIVAYSGVDPIAAGSGHVVKVSPDDGSGMKLRHTAGVRPRVTSPYALVVSRLEYVKGVDVAIRAVALLRERGGVVHLVVAGDGSCRQELEQLVCSLGLSDRVTLLGEVQASTVSALLDSAFCVVVPSREEALGVACLEAMAVGTPVVASNVGGIPEIAGDGDTAILVPPDDSTALAEALSHLLAHPDEAVQRGERGRERVRSSFTWKAALDQYLHAYTLAMDRTERGMETAVIANHGAG